MPAGTNRCIDNGETAQMLRQDFRQSVPVERPSDALQRASRSGTLFVFYFFV